MKKFVIAAMASVGTDPEHAAQLADALILADQRGHYRWVKLVTTIYLPTY
jgi:LDH2 family malate/lactate/ureidoglycolate dehydrogenase